MKQAEKTMAPSSEQGRRKPVCDRNGRAYLESHAGGRAAGADAGAATGWMKAATAASALAFAALAWCGGGCVQRHGYVDPADVHFDSPARATLYDMKAVVADLVENMQADERFRAHYALRQAEDGELPVLQIGNIENYTADHVVQKLESVRRRLEIALRKTGLFDIVDDAASAESVTEAVVDSLVENADAGLKGKDALQAFGKHASPDYLMYGRFRSFADGNRHSYELSLQLIDLRTGRQVWSDLAEIDKE